MFRKLATPVTNLNVVSRGRARAKKLAGDWFHELVTSLAAEATAAEKQAMSRVWGAESSTSLMGVFGNAAITASGASRERTITTIGKRLKKPGTIADPRAASAVEEAKRESESAVLVMDLAQLAAEARAGGSGTGTVPKAAPAKAAGSAIRLGVRGVDGGIGLRIVVPASQLGAIRRVMPGAAP